MGTSAAPDLGTGGGSAASGSAASAIDPIDAMDLSTIGNDVSMPWDAADASIPTDQLIPDVQRSRDGEEPAPRADGRNADGTFTKKPGDPDPATAAADATKTAVPFKYRSMSQTHELEGATIAPDGNLIVPAAKLGEVREAFNALQLARGSYIPTLDKYKGRIQELETENTSLKSGRTVNETKADALVTALTAAIENPDDTQALEALWQLRAAWPQLKANAEATYWKERAEKGAPKPAADARAGAPDPARAGEATRMPTPDAARETTTEYIEQLKIDPQFKGVTDADWKQYSEAVSAKPFAFLRLATAADAAKHQGVKAGDVVFDTDMLAASVSHYAKTIAVRRETEAGKTRLAADNARRTAPSINAPPSPGGGRAPAAGSKRPSTKEELEAWYSSDEL